MASSYMDYVNRDKMSMAGLQALTSGDWDFQIIPADTAVMYMPPMETVHVRTRGISGVNPLPPVQIMQIELRGFTLLQPGKIQTKPDPVTIDLQDVEDQAMVSWIWDWNMKMCNIQNLKSNRREDLFCDVIIWQLNSNRIPVWQYHYYDALPDGSQFQVQFDSEKSPLGSGTVTFNAEYMVPKPLNTEN